MCHSILSPQVGLEHGDLHVVSLAQFARDSFEVIQATGGEDEVVLTCGELTGEGFANPTRGSGDEGG